ncbi:MAG: conjugal transfer protein TraM [Methylococcaceae bacterium]
MAADKIEETIKEIAVKHGIAVGRDDPILILHTINERLMRDSAAAQQDILDRFKEELEVIAHRWGDDAKNKAERTLNAAIATSKETMINMIQEGALITTEAIRREVEASVKKIAILIRESRRTAIMNMAAAGMALVAAGLVLWVTMMTR